MMDPAPAATSPGPPPSENSAPTAAEYRVKMILVHSSKYYQPTSCLPKIAFNFNLFIRIQRTEELILCFQKLVNGKLQTFYFGWSDFLQNKND